MQQNPSLKEPNDNERNVMLPAKKRRSRHILAVLLTTGATLAVGGAAPAQADTDWCRLQSGGNLGGYPVSANIWNGWTDSHFSVCYEVPNPVSGGNVESGWVTIGKNWDGHLGQGTFAVYLYCRSQGQVETFCWWTSDRPDDVVLQPITP